MSTATLAFTPDADSPVWIYRGRQKGKTGTLIPTADDDYAANGLAVSAAIFGMSRLDTVDVHGLVSDGDSATLFEGAYYDKPNLAIQFATSAGDGDPLDESNTSSISGYKLRVTAWGA
jgi:hypothetical protein